MIKQKELLLKEKIINILKDMGYDKEVKDKIIKEFKSRNLSVIRATNVLNGNLDLNTLSDSDNDIMFLFLFSYALEKAIKDTTDCNLNVEDYFTNFEVNRWLEYKEEEKQKSIYPIILEDVYQLADRSWKVIMTAQQLHMLNENNVLIYNFKTQRNPIVTAAGLKISLNKKKTIAIKELLLKNKYYADVIRLNILKGTEVQPIYDEKKKRLIIKEGCVINLFDGWHRKTASSLALEENPELIFNWDVNIVNYSEREAREFMAQINKQDPIKEEYTEQMDTSKAENRVVDAIMDNRNSELANATKDLDGYIKNNKALTKKSILAQAILDNYKDKINTAIDIEDTAEWIVKFTNRLMGTYKNEFIENPYEIKKTSYINNKNMFYGYICLCSLLIGKDNWIDLMKEKIDSIDFSKDNPMWRDIGLFEDKDVNKKTRDKLYKLFGKEV